MSRLRPWFGRLKLQVWILAAGRLLNEMGTGFTLFYAPIYFVNQIGLSATTVGLALGSASVSGIVGRIVGGSLADSDWGRRRTLLLAAAVSGVGSFVLAATNSLVTLVIGNVINGLGVGLYWPATEAVVADLTTEAEYRREAFALTRLADNLGLGMGIMFSGLLVATTSNYRLLFVIDGISFTVFFGVIYAAIKETYQPQPSTDANTSQLASWMAGLSDRRLLIFLAVNIVFTTYISQLHSTLPLYFKNFVSTDNGQGFAQTTIGALFAWHLIVAIAAQLPSARLLRRFDHTSALSISALLWAIGFLCIWASGIFSSHSLLWAITALTVFALAIVSYTPSAGALIGDIAPTDKRGVYFSFNALCWAVGYIIGPPLGGWALDSSPVILENLWLVFSLSVVIAIALLKLESWD